MAGKLSQTADRTRPRRVEREREKELGVRDGVSEETDVTDELHRRTITSLEVEIDDCQREIRKCNRRALKLAIRAGELFPVLEERLNSKPGGADWLKEIAKNLTDYHRKYYPLLAKNQAYLDQVCPGWKKEMSLREVLDLLENFLSLPVPIAGEANLFIGEGKWIVIRSGRRRVTRAFMIVPR